MTDIYVQFFFSMLTESVVLLMGICYGLYFYIHYMSVNRKAETSENSLIEAQIVRKYRK